LGYSKSGKKKRIADDDGLDGMNNDTLTLSCSCQPSLRLIGLG